MDWWTQAGQDVQRSLGPFVVHMVKAALESARMHHASTPATLSDHLLCVLRAWAPAVAAWIDE